MCEDCIKKDVCKYREEVEKLGDLPEPVKCEHRRVEFIDEWSITWTPETTTDPNIQVR